MELPSRQNCRDNDNDSRTQKSSEDADGVENSKKDSNSCQTSEKSARVPKEKVTEDDRVPVEELYSDINNAETSTTSSKINEVTASIARSITKEIKKLPVVWVFSAQQRSRQRYFTNENRDAQRRPPPRLPTPPTYYPSSNRQQQPINRQPERTQAEVASQAQHQYQPPHFYSMGQMALFPNVFINAAYWAPYPTDIPSHVPPCLAHLVDAEVLFIIQKVDFLEFISGMDESNMYLIQNKDGECLYYAYETSDICARACCQHSRGFQLHVLDMYQNEVIYMNRPCGCTFLFCCYPVMEVYAPPTVPVGAITKRCHPFREEFIIIDPDENLIYKIHGGSTVRHCCPCYEYDFSIHALDSEETVVGYIRREFGGYIRTFYTNSDFYGISFPKSMDVRVKAVFLGALFLVSLKRTGWVLRYVKEPETVSGHMYRMSIMTFLIPESTGIDKTRCMKLSLVHDLAECIVGDLTPYCGVHASEKHRQEEIAMKELTQMIGDSGTEIYNLYKEYEAQVTDESKFVKDLDRLDMILQAFEYEKLGNKPGQLEEFFTSTLNKFHFPWTIDIVKEIYKQRNFHINQGNTLGKDP